ncbi:hypothetical protein BJ138DRAFT_1098466 [Hygrophoropsis aurantiaca]|uniref:Uncharacterized protein n=1 Tax=Hygrophoropsis aurantiaca TaxID=72124 RepID=A0ACB8ANZ0_9AGAM|nr:hypothetical protein BJ138DRAFT_1098466 [Hygrophoropsis aurantiaca]
MYGADMNISLHLSTGKNRILVPILHELTRLPPSYMWITASDRDADRVLCKHCKVTTKEVRQNTPEKRGLATTAENVQIIKGHRILGNAVVLSLPIEIRERKFLDNIVWIDSGPENLKTPYVYHPNPASSPERLAIAFWAKQQLQLFETWNFLNADGPSTILHFGYLSKFDTTDFRERSDIDILARGKAAMVLSSDKNQDKASEDGGYNWSH